ncbi:MAG: nitroreductase family protein [Propionibacteriaceae bacterium]|nr:nitroreductase family protein [Propionibacteriaceae bacterium]
MNAVLETIANRYSCRGFSSEPVARKDLETIALAGAQAPSSRGNAPWYLAVVTNREIIDDLRDTAWDLMLRRDKHGQEVIEKRGGDLFYNAQAVIVVATKETRDLTSEDLDAGLLCENICLAAHSLGLATCLCGFSVNAFADFRATDNERLSKLLGFPFGYKMTVSILLGHAAKVSTPHVPDLSKIVYFE